MAVTPRTLARWKQENRPIVALTATDYAFARVLDGAGIDLILVGDSLAMVALGHATTLPLTLDDIIHHAKAVCRGVQRALVVVDLPFLSYQIDSAQAIASAGRILQETGAAAVKLEGGYPQLLDSVKRLVEIGIPVMGHVGLTPQSIHQTGYRQQGQDPAAEAKILAEAIALEQAGVFCLVLEHITADLARRISQQLTIPTIGIGAGSACDGQILVTHDLLGFSERQPPFAKVYTDLQATITTAACQYITDVFQNAQVKHPDFPEVKP
ncbi:MAG: 3-methyl-2-oxobutanoate hydroxymethyltransferase [Oscillatoriales cyanobacterium]|nr:MAG: 3-methyl-2-oxobutanoate hydroxymethyltransferase [Oscillatoriales cyanobacterium]